MTELRPLGHTDIKVTSICLGTMTWGEQNTEAEGHAQLDLATDAGINFIDTAENYSIPPRKETQGSTERIIGTWLKRSGKRSKLILASKISGPSASTYLRADGKFPRLDAKNINEAIDNSLRRLQTDYIDVYQLHWPHRDVPLFGNASHSQARGGDNSEVPIEETLEALDAIVKAGKVRYIALSNETAWGLSRFLHLSETRKLPRVVSVQNAYNFLNRTYENGLSEFAAREKVGLLAYSPLAQGYLTGKYENGARPAGTRITLFNRGQRYEKPGAAQAVTAYVNLARELGFDPAQFAVAYVTSRPFVTSNIIGATSVEQLKTNLGSQSIVITPEIEDRVNALYQIHGSPAP